ncbi:MAG: hypothetical protein N2V75_02025 [Methanophagales archaeon]|nr:hypothetical protein [Methanophagales archaeon]
MKELSYDDITQKIQSYLLWSKAGSKIAYVMRENKTTDIYTINVGKSIMDEGIEKHEIPIDEEGEKREYRDLKQYLQLRDYWQ